MRLNVFLISIFLSIKSFGYVGCSDLNNRVIVYFSNGMSNARQDMKRSLEELEKIYKDAGIINTIHNNNHTIEFQLSINHYEDGIEQLIEVLGQKYDEFDYDETKKIENLNYWLNSYLNYSLSLVPNWFKSTADIFLYEQYKYEDEDLTEMIRNYEQVIASCNKVFVVAHSQGNFYSNYSWDDIYKTLSVNSSNIKDIDDFGLLSVATPSKRVGQHILFPLDHTPYTSYVNAQKDPVALLSLLPKSYINTSFTYGTKDYDSWHHNFIDSYLKGTETKEAIIKDTKKILSNILNIDFDTILTPPTNLAKVLTNTRVQLSWDSVYTNAKYNLYSATESFDGHSINEYSTLSNYHKNDGIIGMFTTMELEENKKYYFVVTATKDEKESIASNKVTAILFNSTTINHNGFTYQTITSPYTEEIWLDRNLGASRVCTSYDDSECYGDYYQWGRNTDGHEKKDSLTTSTQATDIDGSGINPTYFVKSNYGDWVTTDTDGQLRSNKWSKIDGSSVCPIGYRVPTISELFDESNMYVSQNKTSYESFLKLPFSGGRSSLTGTISSLNTKGNLWSSTETKVFHYSISDKYIYTHTYPFATGLQVRCIRN